ncbi:MAG: hypothetical protein Q9210_002622, partial [Variospora velana]
TTNGPVTIGESCVVNEKAVIGLTTTFESTPDEQQEQQQQQGHDGDASVVLENHVVVESKALVEGATVGEGTVVEVGAKVGKGAVVGKYCKIGPLCTVEPYEMVPDHTVIYGYNERRIDRSGADRSRAKTMEQHIDMLRKVEMAARRK